MPPRSRLAPAADPTWRRFQAVSAPLPENLSPKLSWAPEAAPGT